MHITVILQSGGPSLTDIEFKEDKYIISTKSVSSIMATAHLFSTQGKELDKAAHSNHICLS